MTAREVSLAGAVVLAMATAAGCMGSLGHPPGPAAPPTGSDAEVVFQQIATIRHDQAATPPTWIAKLAPAAQTGAARLADGVPGRVVADETAKRAVSNIGRNVEVWWVVSDSLYGMDLAKQLVGRHNLMLAIGVAQMQRGSAGRYAIVMITPEAGMGPSF